MASTKKVQKDPVKALQPGNKEVKYVKVYVWELPVRIFHWVNAFSILFLMLTGIYIANPIFGPVGSTHATPYNVMGLIRNIHFVCAFVFALNLIIRAYWFVKGNRYARSNPFKKEFWSGLFETLKSYLFMKNNKKHYYGHNPLAELSYWIFIVLGSILISITGFYMLFEPQPDTWWGLLFSWVPAIFGDSFDIRGWHHVVAWFFVIFVIIHVYMSFREDWLSKNGTMSSIFTGYKLEEEHEDEK